MLALLPLLLLLLLHQRSFVCCCCCCSCCSRAPPLQVAYRPSAFMQHSSYTDATVRKRTHVASLRRVNHKYHPSLYRYCYTFLLFMDTAFPCNSDLQAALFGGGGVGGRARSLHLLQRYIIRSQENFPDNDNAADIATTTAIETLCSHFLSCVTPNTAAQHLLISAISTHVLSFPLVSAACQRLSSNFAHRNHIISWVHTIVSCIESSVPPVCQGGRYILQLLIHHLLQVIFTHSCILY
jgi:hypothetical protein